MKLSTTTQQERVGFAGMETQAFTVAANGKAFRILLDGLYTNKVRAVARELMTNAYDAHLAVGMGDIPFDIHLPTIIDPTFKVRDYGVSMTHEQVMHLYTTIFDSTKDTSNEMVGALGLGSKSPFAYTDSFTVVARLNGEKRTYFATMGGDGTPQLTHAGTVVAEPGDDAQGVEVVIPVRPDDFAEFAEEVKLLSVGFDPLPQVDGLEIEPYEPVYVGGEGSFAIFAPDVLPGSAQLAVRQGCVIYPVDDYSLREPIRSVLKNGYQMVIDVAIGEVAVTASREALQLDDETRKNVRFAVEWAVELVKEEVYALADKLPNTLAATKFWYGVEQGDHVLFDAFAFPAKYRGKPVHKYVSIKGGRLWETPKVYSRKKTNKVPENLNQVDVTDIANLKFVIKRSDQHVPRSMIRYRQYVDKTCGRYGSGGVYLWVDPDKRALARVVSLLGLRADQIVPIGSLDDPGPPLRLKTADGEKGLQGVNEVTGQDSWKKVSKVDGDYYWFEVPRISKDAVSGMMNRYARMLSLGFPERTIYALTPGAVGRVKPDAADSLKAELDDFEAANEQKFLDIIENYLYNQGVAQVGLTEHVATVPVSNSEYNRAAELFPHNAYYQTSGKGYEAKKRAERRIADLKETYPLLFSATTDAIKWYVSAINNEKGIKP